MMTVRSKWTQSTMMSDVVSDMNWKHGYVYASDALSRRWIIVYHCITRSALVRSCCRISGLVAPAGSDWRRMETGNQLSDEWENWHASPAAVNLRRLIPLILSRCTPARLNLIPGSDRTKLSWVWPAVSLLARGPTPSWRHHDVLYTASDWQFDMWVSHVASDVVLRLRVWWRGGLATRQSMTSIHPLIDLR